MKTLKNKLKKQGGFTLVEMLTVVAIIAILIAISIPMVTGALDRAKKATDSANIRAAKACMAIEALTDTDYTSGEIKAYDALAGQLSDSDPTKEYRKYFPTEADKANKFIYVTTVKDVVYYQWAGKKAGLTAPSVADDGTVTLNGWETEVPSDF